MNYKKRQSSWGISVLEVMLAAAVFAIFASPALVVTLQGLDLNRTAAEQTEAAAFATEGIEAVRSLKNRTFENMVTTSCGAGVGVEPVSGAWEFSGGQTVFEKYTRTIEICPVYRDGSGNIVSIGGTIDPATVRADSVVTWLVGGVRSNTLTFSTYLTDWNPDRKGILVYTNGITSSDSVVYKVFNNATGQWSAASPVADIDAGTTNRALRAVTLFASSTRSEKIMLSRHYNGSTQYIYAQVYNGSTWGNVVLLSSFSGGSYLDVRNFDGAYLANGDFMTVYYDGTTTPKFRVWNGVAWGSQLVMQNLANNSSDRPNVIVTRARPGTNEVMAAFYDQSLNTNTQYFNGGSYATGSWTLHARHGSNGEIEDKKILDFSWSPVNPLVGILGFNDARRDTTINVRIFTANGTGGGSWGTNSNNPTGQGRMGPLAIAARPLSAVQFLVCDQDRNRDILCFRTTSAPAWSNPSNYVLETNTDNGIQQTYDIAFEAQSGATGVAVYSDNTTTPQLKTYTASSNTFSASAQTFGSLNQTLESVRLRPLPGSDDIMIVMGGSTTPSRVYTAIYNGSTNQVYTTPAGKALTQQGTNGSLDTEIWYDFVWDPI